MGENGQPSLNVMRTRMLPRVTAKTPENGLAMGENVETGNVRQKWEASLNMTWTRTLPRLTAETPENG
jgi:hypothetical protein